MLLKLAAGEFSENQTAIYSTQVGVPDFEAQEQIGRRRAQKTARRRVRGRQLSVLVGRTADFKFRKIAFYNRSRYIARRIEVNCEFSS